jgi:hypothetical protein
MYLDADREIELNSLVREYLAYAEYPNSLDSFDGECSIKGRPASSSSRNVNEEHTDVESDEILAIQVI